MDNNAFETNMFNAVNNHAKDASEARDAEFQDGVKKWKERRKAERINALLGILFWVLGFAVVMAVVGVLNWLGKVPNEYAILISAVVGIATGARLCILVNKI